MPTLSAVRLWDTAHLIEAAAHWARTAAVWEGDFTELAAHIGVPGGAPWEGLTAEAAQQRAHSDRMTIIALADRLHSAAGIARTGASEIGQARLAVLRAVHAAEGAGFMVGEDFSVTDPYIYNAATSAARQAQAVAYAGDLRSRVSMLVAADRGFAAELVAAAEGLGTVMFPESGGPDADTADRN
nr:hypothetical protein [Mycobacterium sp.]